MFWKYNLITASHIETLLNKENVTLRELMDEDDILQECKAQTKKLIDFLVRPEIMDEMVTLITQEPEDDVEEKHRFKYSNIACELLTFDVGQINDALSGDEALLNKLYSFLDTEKPLNPLLASFFSKTMGLLIMRKTETFFEFLKSKEEFISLILSHIETSAIMDLLLRLVTCIECNEMRYCVVKWLNEQKVIERLVSLIDASYSAETNNNAAHALCDIIRVSREHMSMLQEKAEPDPLLETVESTDVVGDLLIHMFREEKKESVIVNGVMVLLALLEFKKQGPAGTQQIPQNQSQSCLQAENAPQTFTALFFRSDGQEQMTALDAERLAKGVNNVLAAVVPHLTDFHQLLLEPPVKPSITLTFGHLDPPFGFSRLEVARLVTALITTNNHDVNVQLASLGTISVLWDLFFKYSWNNFLHTQVEQAVGRILTNTPTTDEEGNKVHPLLDQIFNQCKLIQRIVDAWEENEREQSKPGMHRKGYMGHLTKIANHFVQNLENGVNSENIKQFIRDLPDEYYSRCDTFVSVTLDDINKKNNTPLVNGVPSGSSDLESVEFRDISFTQETALQQAFSDYQMQQMTSNFDDQFGFNDDEFVDTEENLTGQLNRLAHVNFHLSAEGNLRRAELFERLCGEKIQTVDDADSDEDVWEDKENDTTFNASVSPRQRKSSEGNSSDSDEDAHVPKSASPVVPASDDMKMDIDNQEGWTANFDSVPMDVAPVGISNPWDSADSQSASSDNQGNWADFSNFADFGSSSVECSSEMNSATVAMETSDNSSASKLTSTDPVSSTDKAHSVASSSTLPVACSIGPSISLGVSSSEDKSSNKSMCSASGDVCINKSLGQDSTITSTNKSDIQDSNMQKGTTDTLSAEVSPSAVQNGPV